MNNELIKRFISSIIMLPIIILVILKGSFIFNLFLFFLFLLASYEWFKMSKKKIIKSFLGILFLILSFYSAYQLRDQSGFNFFIFLVLICVFTDIGGFFFGKLFKGPKLTKISPKKTYSGVIGSFVLPLFFGLISYSYTNLNYSEFIKINLILLILIISFTSQLGDLIISYFKRIAKVKDTGKFLPGHGGILDRIDGLIFVIPFIYLITIL